MLESLPDSLILKILSYLDDPLDIAHVGYLSAGLRDVCHDQLLWRGFFHRYFQLPSFYSEPVVCSSWRSEFIRIHAEIPIVESEVLRQHSDQVLHVCFSNDGKRFVTTGKDCKIHVWKSTYPTECEYSYEMREFGWKYTQFSQFNESDSLLLVSGVQVSYTSGDIAVFEFKDGFKLRCRTRNKPYDFFGCWYSEKYFFSGDHHYLGNLISKSDIWLNKASQETDSEHTAILNHIFKFYNRSASSIRSILVANCGIPDLQFPLDGGATTELQLPLDSGATAKNKSPMPLITSCANSRWPSGNPFSRRMPLRGAFNDQLNVSSQSSRQMSGQEKNTLDYTEEFHRSREEQQTLNGEGSIKTRNPNEADQTSSGLKTLKEVNSPSSPSTDVQQSFDFEEAEPQPEAEDEVMDPREKLLIFTCGSQAYTPHQIGFKRIKPFAFKGRLELGMTLAERIEEKKRRDAVEPDNLELIDYSNFEDVAHLFDIPDAVLNLHGQIIGMTLSPDHRHLYVNSRPWPVGAVISNPRRPPPIAQEIDVHVIDLVTLKQVGMMRQVHRAYTPNDECFFIFLDACEEYLGSGSEDRAGYVWDRQYGLPLCRLPHLDVVNAVAFNPKNSEMLVTVSDDNTVKVWRSKRLCRELGINYQELPQGTKINLNLRTAQPPTTIPPVPEAR